MNYELGPKKLSLLWFWGPNSIIVYTPIMELSSQNHNRDGLSGPNSIMVGPSGQQGQQIGYSRAIVYTQCSRCASPAVVWFIVFTHGLLHAEASAC